MLVTRIQTSLNPGYNGKITESMVDQQIKDELSRGNNSKLYQMVALLKNIKERKGIESYEKGCDYSIVIAGFIASTRKEKAPIGDFYYRIVKNQVLKNRTKPVLQFFEKKDSDKSFASSRMVINFRNLIH